MTRIWKGAAIALALSCAPSAHAADYIRYNLLAQGGGGVTSMPGGQYSFTPLDTIAFTYVIESSGFNVTTTAASQSYAAGNLFGPIFFGGQKTATTNATGLSFAQAGSDGRGQGGAFSAVLCGPAGVTFPTVAFAIDPACSTATYSFRTSLSSINFGGTISSFTVQAFTATSAETGLTAAFVPEPSTWALMLAGFGMAGYALRRRRVAMATA